MKILAMRDAYEFRDNKNIHKFAGEIADIFGKGSEFRAITNQISKIRASKDHDAILRKLQSMNLPRWYNEIAVPLNQLYYEAYCEARNDLAKAKDC